LDKIANTIVKAAIGSALTQGVAVATGLQKEFSWRSVAASAITAGVTQGVGEAMGGANWQNSSSLSDFGKFAIDAGSRFIGGTVAQAVTNKGGRVNFGQVAADAFGNALGNSIAQGIAGSYGRSPDQTDAESARLARSGNAYGQTQRTLLNAANRASEPDYFSSAAHDPLGDLITRNPQWAKQGGWRAPEPMGPRYASAVQPGGYYLPSGGAGEGLSTRGALNAANQATEHGRYTSRRGFSYTVQEGDTYSGLSGNNLSKVGLWSTVNGKDLKTGKTIWLDDLEQFGGDAHAAFKKIGGNLYARDNARLAEQARQKFLFSDGRDTKDIRLSPDYQTSMTRQLGQTYKPYAQTVRTSENINAATVNAGGSLTDYVDTHALVSPEFGGTAGTGEGTSLAQGFKQAAINTGELAVGATEMVLGGAYNSVVRIGGGLASIPYAAFGADAAVAVQDSAATLNYKMRSEGAQMIGQALEPMAKQVGEVTSLVRNVSEQYLGDGVTTFLGAALQVGAESWATVTGLRSLKGLVGDIELIPSGAARSTVTGAAADASEAVAAAQAQRSTTMATQVGSTAQATEASLGGAAWKNGIFQQAITPRSNLELYGQAITRTPEEAKALLTSVGHDAETLGGYKFVPLSESRYAQMVAEGGGKEFSAKYGVIPPGQSMVRFDADIASSLVSASGEKVVPVFVHPSVFRSDEAIVQVLSHEIHEIEHFRYGPGVMSSTQYDAATTALSGGNLHAKAVAVGDSALLKFRQMFGY
jgi:hypothetical protein